MELLNSNIYSLKPYTPGEQPDRDLKFIKLNTNENPYPPSPGIRECIDKIISSGELRKYPNPISKDLVKEIAKQNQIKENQILITNGSDEGLALLFKAVLKPKSKVVFPYPTYSLYPILTNIQMNDSVAVQVPLLSDFHFDIPKLKQTQGKLLTFAHPNAPTSIQEDKESIIEIVKNFHGVVLCDEAYIDFAPKGSSMIDQVNHFENLVVSRTFSKSYSLAGIRVGYLIAQPSIIDQLYKIKDSYNVGMLEQEIALAALKDQVYLEKITKKILESRNMMKEELEKLGFLVLDSQTNFLYVRPPKNLSANEIYLMLKNDRILVRYFDEEACKDFLRITIGNQEENHELLNKMKSYIK